MTDPADSTQPQPLTPEEEATIRRTMAHLAKSDTGLVGNEAVVVRLLATLDARRAARTADPGGRLFAAVRRVIVDGYDAPGVHAELHAAFYEARDRTADPGGLHCEGCSGTCSGITDD